MVTNGEVRRGQGQLWLANLDPSMSALGWWLPNETVFAHHETLETGKTKHDKTEGAGRVGEGGMGREEVCERKRTVTIWLWLVSASLKVKTRRALEVGVPSFSSLFVLCCKKVRDRPTGRKISSNFYVNSSNVLVVLAFQGLS